MKFKRKSLAVVLAISAASVGSVFQATTAATANELEAICVPSSPDDPSTTITGDIKLNREQDVNGRLIVGISEKLGLPGKAPEVAIAAALAQSSMRYLPPNEANRTDAQGMFQQRSAVYPGVDLTNPAQATEAFLLRLSSIEGWEAIPNGELAQAVVGSSRHDVYDRREADAKELVAFYAGDPSNPTSCLNPGMTPGAPGENPETPPTTPPEPGTVITPTEIPGIVELRGIRVHESIAKDVDAMFAAAEADGLDLKVNSSWRDPEKQIQLRRQNCGTSQFDIFEKSPSLCSPPTARPGTSQHEKGLAIDFANCNNHSTACWKWLDENAATYGLKNFPREPWHWSSNGR